MPERKPDSRNAASSEQSGSDKTDSEKDGPLAPGKRPSLAWTKIEIESAKKECAALLDALAIDYEALDPIREGECGAPAPILVKSIGSNPPVEIAPPATLRCPVAAALGKWLEKVVQPEARALFDAPVVKMRNAADYHCRNRYGKTGGKLSEHALANALDISVFTLQSETTVALAGSWPKAGQLSDKLLAETPPLPERNPEMLAAAEAAEKRMNEALGMKGPKFQTVALRTVESAKRTESVSMARVVGEQILEVMQARIEPQAMAATPSAQSSSVEEPSVEEPEELLEPPLETKPDTAGQFMVRIHAGACDHFGTVLGPKANAAHKSHFHFDMIERRSSYCQ